jgi:hypothetical protein
VACRQSVRVLVPRSAGCGAFVTCRSRHAIANGSSPSRCRGLRSGSRSTVSGSGTPAHLHGDMGNPPRPFVIPDDRECSVSVHDWTLRLTPWGRWGEWRTADPWWIRGVSLNLLDAFLGRTKYTTDTVRSGIPLVIPDAGRRLSRRGEDRTLHLEACRAGLRQRAPTSAWMSRKAFRSPARAKTRGTAATMAYSATAAKGSRWNAPSRRRRIGAELAAEARPRVPGCDCRGAVVSPLSP